MWEKQELDGVTAAIVFRGTDGRDDWWSNLRWITRAVPFVRDHYMQVKYLTPRLIQAIDERHGKPIPILTSGHSLGGGLAQQAAYVSDHIKRVYAFNSTPVTGFYGVPDPPRRQNIKGIQIKRIYEHGEILAYVRRFMRLFNPLTVQDPEIIEIRFNLLGKMDAIGQHNMRKLAYNLKRKASRHLHPG